MRVAFVHPDLGIGGAERLVVDAALALDAVGHDPLIYTAHFDRARCFSELATTPPLVAFKRVSVASLVPLAIFGRCQVCSTFRCVPLPFPATNNVTTTCFMHTTDRLTKTNKQTKQNKTKRQSSDLNHLLKLSTTTLFLNSSMPGFHRRFWLRCAARWSRFMSASGTPSDVVALT